MNITHDVKDAAYNIFQTYNLRDDILISQFKSYLRSKWQLGTGWNGRGMIEIVSGGSQVYVVIGDRTELVSL